MNNFEYFNPVKIVFGKGQIARLPELIPAGTKIMITCGGGSIFKNGVYDQVKKALAGYNVVEFHGIEPNPQYATLMKAVELGKKENVDLLLAVGGGSTLDGTKFIASAIKYDGDEPWDILEKGAPIKDAVPLVSIITLPATGSEMNAFAVISRAEKNQKLALYSPLVFPRFSIIDPETTFSLPPRQTANGIVDTFVHVVEQYITHPVNAPLQDRQAEALLLALLDEAPKVIANPNDYDARANIFWMATQALNGWLNVGTVQCWATHGIGHELTAQTGTDHGRTLALVLPALWKYQRKEKGEKLIQFGKRVWGITGDDPDQIIDETIAATKKFFESVGIKATRAEYGVTDEVCRAAAKMIGDRGVKLGDRANIGEKEVYEILQLCD
ncbi:MAG: iron-containing alcohol dehydrogenase [Thermoguttaceae bacterium]|nr:iron-containing alcohol dehydrogenase [Thermoguttaceae bacterium]